jgi:hypothetical protein
MQYSYLSLPTLLLEGAALISFALQHIKKLPNYHIRVVELPSVQLPTASQINLLLILFSFLGEFFYQVVAPKIPNILFIYPLSFVKVRPHGLFANDIPLYSC